MILMKVARGRHEHDVGSKRVSKSDELVENSLSLFREVPHRKVLYDEVLPQHAEDPRRFDALLRQDVRWEPNRHGFLTKTEAEIGWVRTVS